MKKLFLLAAGAFLLTANLTSCKKGENDPALSLKSRKARLTGEWTVTNMTGDESQIYTDLNISESYSANRVYNGKNQINTIKDVNGNVKNVSTSDDFTLTFTFKKDGTFTIAQKETANSSEMSSSGNWVFLDKNKNSKLKKKEAILLSMTSEKSVNNGESSVSTFSGLQGSSSLIFEIDELKSKKMTLIDESEQVKESFTYKSKTTYTLTAK